MGKGGRTRTSRKAGGVSIKSEQTEKTMPDLMLRVGRGGWPSSGGREEGGGPKNSGQLEEEETSNYEVISEKRTIPFTLRFFSSGSKSEIVSSARQFLSKTPNYPHLIAFSKTRSGCEKKPRRLSTLSSQQCSF